MTIQDQINDVVNKISFGKANARKSYGQYKPVIVHANGRTEICGKVERALIWRGAEPLPGGPTHFVRGKVFDSRENAIDYANAIIKARKEAMVAKMNDPRYRALREQYGLPAYI